MRYPSSNRIPLSILVSLLVVAGAACAQVDADIPQAKVTQKAVTFQGIPGTGQGGEVSITQTFTLTEDDLSWAKDINADVYANGVELSAVSGVQDLSFIHYARITMSSGSDPATTPIEVVNYQRPDNATVGPVLAVPTTSPINVTSVWAAKKVVFTVEIAGLLPEQGWAADITLQLSGKLSYKF